MKIFLRLILTLALLLPSSVLAASFSDVPDEHPNFTAIEFLKHFQVVNGYSDGTFRPDNTVNRAEALKMILLAAGVEIGSQFEIGSLKLEETEDSEENQTTLKTFSDVADGVWFYDFVYTAVDEKIVDGYDDGTFKPDQPVIMAEALKMAFQAFDIDELPTEFENPYIDVSNDLWFAPFAAFTASKNITLPQDDGALHAGEEISRADLAELLYRFRYVANHDLEAVPFDFGWQTYEDDEIGFKTVMPPAWDLVNNPRSVLFWKKDPAFTNVHEQWLYPNAATINFSSYENKENFSKEDFFEQLKFSSTYTYNQVESIEMNVNGLDVLKIKQVDSHKETYIFELPNNRFLVIFSDYGAGAYAPYLKKSIDVVVNSVESFSTAPPDPVKLKEEIFKALLLEGKAEELLDMLPDEVLFEADSLGVGTGPVDYYYSALIDMTLKIERNTSILLDARDGQTSAF